MMGRNARINGSVWQPRKLSSHALLPRGGEKCVTCFLVEESKSGMLGCYSVTRARVACQLQGKDSRSPSLKPLPERALRIDA